MSTAVPVKKGQIIELTMDNLSHDGQGVGRYQGFTVFVPQAVPGDRVQVQIISLQKNYARGLITQILRPSSIRCNPPCRIFSACGGCQLQHIPYEEQLAFKRQVVVDSLTRIGKLQGVNVRPTLGMADPWHYRNKAQIPLGRKGNRLLAGFYAPGSHQIVDMPEDGCRIQPPLTNRILTVVRQLIAKYQLSIYSEKTGRGLLRHLFVRVGEQTEEAMVVLVINGVQLPQGKDIARELMEAIPQVVSFGISINTRQTSRVLGDEIKILAGKEGITDYIGPFRFAISAPSFFQVNPVQTEVLYNKALEYANLTGRENAVDAYCGIGTISLFLAQKARIVIGIETVDEAIRDARENARRNGVKNVQFLTGAVEQALPTLWEQGFHPDVILLDPPRKGCTPAVLDTLAQMKPERIVYVSCNPTTLARDLATLCQMGYQVQEVQPVDMFPQTSHVECVTLMSRVKK